MNDTTQARQAAIGSISSGTMRLQDLIPTFCEELEYLANGTSQEHAKLIAECEALEQDGEGYYKDAEQAGEYLSDLFDALQEYAPPYCTFGASEGDGASYGFWPCPESMQEEVPQYDDGPPAGYVGEYYSVNDHGNVTLYVAQEDGTTKEVWGIV